MVTVLAVRCAVSVTALVGFLNAILIGMYTRRRLYYTVVSISVFILDNV